MKLYGPDSLRSWIAVVLAGLVQISVLFSLKTMGIIFFGFRVEWSLSRKEASWPLTLFIVSSQLFGPGLPLLQKIVPASALLPLSCIVSSVSLMLSYFATNLVHMSIVLAVHGFSIAAIYIFSTFLLMQHFERKRTAATAVTSTIATGSTIFASNAMQSLMASFGVRHSLVIVGAVGLVLVPFSMGLRTPRWYSEKNEKTPEVDRNPSVEVEADDLLESEKGRSASTETSSSRSGRSMNAMSRPRRPFLFTSRFAVHALSVTVTYTSMNLFLQLAYDHALDMNVSEDLASYVVPVYCIGDLIARFSSGIIIDSKMISWQGVLAFGYTLEGLCFVALVAHSGPVMLLVLSFLVGCTCGSKVSLVPVQLVNDFGLARLVLSSGATFCISGCVALSRPWFVGYFRDVRGSYNGLFLVLGILCALCSIYWLTRAMKSKREDSTDDSPEKPREEASGDNEDITSAKISEV